MPRRSSSFSYHRQVSEECQQQQSSSHRRVSFDLSHNTIHILPTLKECREAASRLGKEAHQRRTLNEEMLSDLIIVEIQEACTATSRPEEEQQAVLKGCLKTPPSLGAMDEKQGQTTRKKSSSKKSKHQKKKNKRKANADNQHGCTIEAREDPLMSSHTPVF